MKIKVLQINTILNSGATGSIVNMIGESIIKMGWESYIVYGRNPGNSSSQLIKVGNITDNILHGIKTRIFDRHGFGSKSSTLRLLKQIDMIEPTIIHLHNMHGYYLNIKILFDYLVLNNVKVLWTMHDCWAITGHCSHFDFVACNKWKSQCHHCPQKKEYPTSLFFDQSKSNYQIKKKLFNSLENLTIVPVSFWLENILKESFLNKYPTRVIHNGIDVEVFSPGVSSFRDKFNIKAEKKIILGVANIWNGRKGLKDLIHISEKLGTDYQVVIAGLNHQQLKHLPETIIKLPRTNDKHFLVSLYRAANVFVNPTVEDSFPTTNLEAMACGTPVITYKTGGCEEAIIEGVGKTIEKGDVKEMISSIKNISKLSMSDSCSKHIRKNFNNKIQYQKYIKQYHHILN